MLGWTIFHGLDIAAVLVLAGVFIFLRRRLRDPGALAVERSGDFLALAGLFAVSVTGLFLTVSSMWLEGSFYAALNTLHALTVILGLMYLPVRQAVPHLPTPRQPRRRVLQAGQRRRRRPPLPALRRRFASAQQIADLQEVLPQVGFDYAHRRWRQLPGHLPEVPPRELSLAQSARVGGFG
jgi:hypothetical protein